MKRFWGMIAMMSLTFIVLAACNNEREEKQEGSIDASGKKEEVVLSFPHIFEVGNPAHQAIENFKAEVEEKSDGRITIELFPNGELYSSDREIIEAIQLGNTDMSLVGAPSLGSFDENFYVLDLPYIFKNKQDAKAALQDELGEKLAASLENHTLKKISWGHESLRHILNSKRPVYTPEDLKGVKLRVQESEIQEDIFKAMGANPSPLAFGELYSALQQNTFDGIDSTISLVDSQKFYEVQQYLSLTSHTYSGTITLMNNELFNNLSSDLQEILLTAGENMEEDYYVLIEESEQESLKKFEDENLLEINELSDAEFEAFRESVQSVYGKYEDVLDEGLLDLAKSYSK